MLCFDDIWMKQAKKIWPESGMNCIKVNFAMHTPNLSSQFVMKRKVAPRFAQGKRGVSALYTTKHVTT